MSFSKTNKAQVWNCGGGTQSCAIAALIVQGRLPKPDFSVIADTTHESGGTWNYMDRILIPELKKVGVDLIRISRDDFHYKREKLWQRQKDGTLDPNIPAYSTRFQNNPPNKISAGCSSEWKGETVDIWFSRIHGITRSQRVHWIGFSRDEQRRIVKMQQCEDFQNGLIRFPLLEVLLTRRECIKLVEDIGWPTPPRSACWMCPNKSDHEWRLEISERPDEFTKAVEFEREMQKTDPDAWLHRSCVPLDQVDFSQPEDLFSRPCDSGLCFV